jgi:hypothetical protein
VTDALTILLFLGLAALVAYQVYMMFWAKKTVRNTPRIVTVLRWVNIVALTSAAVLIAFALARM